MVFILPMMIRPTVYIRLVFMLLGFAGRHVKKPLVSRHPTALVLDFSSIYSIVGCSSLVNRF